MDLCKTRTKKASPHMSKFYVDLAGLEKVSDADRATTCRRKFKAPSLQTKCTKMECLKKTTYMEKPFDDFRQNKIHFLT